jgi:hypothetical protein
MAFCAKFGFVSRIADIIQCSMMLHRLLRAAYSMARASFNAARVSALLLGRDVREKKRTASETVGPVKACVPGCLVTADCQDDDDPFQALLLAKRWVQQINASALALDPWSRGMPVAIPCQESGLSFQLMFVAVATLVAGDIDPNDDSGGEVEPFYGVPLLPKHTQVRITARRERFHPSGRSSCLAPLDAPRSLRAFGIRYR